MNARLNRAYQIAKPYLRANRVLALLGMLALAVAVSFWVWNLKAKTFELRLGAGIELKYRKELVGILCEEAASHDLKIDVQQSPRSTESIARVSSGELDAAVVPAGLAVQDDKVRQVAVFDCEPLQLFVKPGVATDGVAGLRGKRVNLGGPGTGARILAGKVMDFMGLKAGVDFQDESFTFQEILAMPPQSLPDGIISLSPLPSPAGEQLVHKYGYRLMELPFGAALGLRYSTIEDVTIPMHTYGVDPAVPDRPLHTVGTRALLVANANVSAFAVRRLLEVLYESDFARRAGMPPLSDTAILRSAEYQNHAGTLAYLHRHDPWVNKDLIDNLTNLRGVFVSIISAALLIWQWYRRRNTAGLSDYMLAVTDVELEARRAVAAGEFDTVHCDGCLRRLADVRFDALQQHHDAVLPGDQQFALLLSRIDDLHQQLPRMIGQKTEIPQPTARAVRRAS